jgi:hypothetical protein
MRNKGVIYGLAWLRIGTIGGWGWGREGSREHTNEIKVLHNA